MDDATHSRAQSLLAEFRAAGQIDPDGLITAIIGDLSPKAGAPESLEVDAYLPLLDALDLSTAQKTDLLTAVWIVVDSVLRYHFGLDPCQQIYGETPENTGAARSGVVELSHSKTMQFNKNSAD